MCSVVLVVVDGNDDTGVANDSQSILLHSICCRVILQASYASIKDAVVVTRGCASMLADAKDLAL